MNHLLAWLITIIAFAGVLYPIIRYIGNKYYYVDTNPIQFRLNKKIKLKKRYYSNMKRRNKKHLVVNKINNYSYNKYRNSRLTKINK